MMWKVAGHCKVDRTIHSSSVYHFSNRGLPREEEDLFPNVVTEPRGRLDDSVGFASRRLESE